MHLLDRIVLRFAARRLNIPPVQMDSCKHCGGAGIHTDSHFDVKSVCTRCFGTGTDPKSVKSLEKEARDLEIQYSDEMSKFKKEKEPWVGKSRPPFGTQRGYGIQALRIKMTARKEQLKKELDRLDLGKKLAQVAGAAAK